LTKKFRMIGFGHKSIESLDTDTLRGVTGGIKFSDLAENIAYAFWIDECRYVTIDEEN